MAGAFQSSAFQNNAFQTDATVVIPPPGGGAGYVHSFTRKKFDELKAAERAAEEAERRARELRVKKKRARVVAAIKAAEAVLEEAREQEIVLDLAPLTKALESTARARTVLDMIEQANRVAALAQRAMDELEDEAEAEMLLLSQ